MPKPRLSPRSVNQDTLSALRDQGADSEVLLARLAIIESEGLRKDLAKMLKGDRCYPEILPTQASLRWSTKKPNLVGFQREFWTKHPGIIYPDPGEWWLEWDWKGIEARMYIAYSGDQEDLDWLRPPNDIHTLTCQHYLFEWKELPSDWQGSKDERRTRAKNFRYAMQYGADERAILGMPGIEKLGLDRQTLVGRARRFLQARPQAVAWKARVFQTCQEDKVARTFMGARRKLFGDADTRAKEGLNHMIQGSVANLMAWCLVKIDNQWPESRLILNKHDGAIVAFPDRLAREGVKAESRLIVEREWEVGQGVTMAFPATWKEVHAC